MQMEQPQENRLTRYKKEQEILVQLDKYVSHDSVESMHIGDSHVKLKFKDGIIINRRIMDYNPYNMWKYKIEVGKEFPLKPLESNQAQDVLFSINNKYFTNAGLCDRDVALHGLIFKLQNQKWQHPKYPTHVLRDDWNYLCEKAPRYTKRNVYISAPVHQPGRLIQTNFYDFGRDANYVTNKSFEYAWSSGYQLYYSLSYLIDHNFPITLTNLMCRLTTRNVGRTFVPPGFYISLFKRLGLENKHVHDMTPCNWSRAIAASYLNMRYTYNIPNKYGDDYNNFMQEIGKKPNTSYALFDMLDCDLLMFDDNTESVINVKSYLPMLGRRFKILITSASNDDTSAVHIPYILNNENYLSLKIYK